MRRCRMPHVWCKVKASLQNSTSAGRKDVKLLSVKVDGKQLSDGDYKLEPSSLNITSLPKGSFQVQAGPIESVNFGACMLQCHRANLKIVPLQQFEKRG